MSLAKSKVLIPKGEPRLNFNELLFWQLLLFVAVLALIASYFTNTHLYSSWYNNLDLPPWYPPAWLFALMWTVIYLLVAFTAYIGIKLDPYRYAFLALFVLGMFVNVMWCLAFFTLESVSWGFGLIVLLDVIVLAQIIYLLTVGARMNNKALLASGGLLLIYLGWGIYATTLNGYIYANI
jgi:translocator protein